MTQPTPLQAEVNVRALRAAQARDAMDHPVELRQGQVRSITLTIPLLTDRNSYLVVRLPDAAVQGMLEHARTLPANERNDFIRQWIIRNQQVIIEQHVRSGGRERRFRYDVVPIQVQPRVSEATPRRVEPAPQPPVGTAVPRREQPTAPQPAAPAQPARRVIQPGQPAQPPQVRVEPQPRPVFAPDRPAERPVAPPPAPRVQYPMPEQIKGGSGTTADRYCIFMSRVQFERRRRTETTIDWPFTLDIEGFGQVSFRAFLTESQASTDNRGRTSSQIWTIIEGTLRHNAEARGVRLDNTALRDARRGFNRAFSQAMAQYDAAE